MAEPPPGRTLPLAGVTVAEIVDPAAPAALALAAGLCGRIAADLGAHVVRLGGGPAIEAEAEAFLHRGKDHLAVGEAQRAGFVRDLSARVDAIVCDPSTHDTADAAATRLRVVLSMSRDAPTGGSEFTIEARAGLLDLVGDRLGSPLRLAGHQTAYAGGLAAYLALVIGVMQGRAGWAAGPKRVDLLDVAVWLNWKTLAIAARTGACPTRAGPDSEWTVLPCADGNVALVYRVPEWAAMKRLVADARLDEDRFQSVAGRRAHRTALNAIFATYFAGRTRAEIRAESLVAKLPLGPVWTPEDLLRDPHMLARGFFAQTEVNGRRVPLPSLPVRWNEAVFVPERVREPTQPDLVG